MHARLAITLDGLPLGLTAARFWTRAQFKGLLALKRKVNQTRVPIETKESMRWLENMRTSTSLLGDAARLVHIGDRENDIYEFFCATQGLGTHFVVRICVDRLAGNGKHTRSHRTKRSSDFAVESDDRDFDFRSRQFEKVTRQRAGMTFGLSRVRRHRLNEGRLL